MVQVLVWAGDNRPSSEGAQRGDIIDVLNDGVHPGTKIVSGPNWDDPADGGDFVIVDIPGVTRKQARQAVANQLGISVDLPTLNRIAFVDRTLLPPAATASFQATGRATATGAQFRSVLSFKAGKTLQQVRDRLTNDGLSPDALTREYPE